MTLVHPLTQYASSGMLTLWSPTNNVRLERMWWIGVMRWLRRHTTAYDHIDDIDQKIDAYYEARDSIDLEAIQSREQVTKHDLKARIEEFNYQAQRAYYWSTEQTVQIELAHWGMTSADVVDNITLIRMHTGLTHLTRAVNSDSMAWSFLRDSQRALPLRGLKGPVGTQQDLLDLIGDADKVRALDEYLASRYGFGAALNSVGQVNPRSLDFMVVVGLGAAVRSVGSPQPWQAILNGYQSMVAEYSGDQWNEGDVTTSVIRRVALPGAFMAAEAALRGVKP